MKAHDFKLPDQNGKEWKLSDFAGKWLLLYFYPKDDTPGCITEAVNFRNNLVEFQDRGVEVLGVSKDSVASHQKFSDKYQLDFPLLSDPEHKVIEAYGSWGKKKFMGREFTGTLRNSYLINPKGEMVKEYLGVNPLTTAGEILRDLDSLI